MKYSLPRIEVRTVHEPLCSNRRIDNPYNAALILSKWLSRADRENVVVVNLQSDLHPSGNLEPSDADIRVTEDLSRACSFLHMPLIDHVITGPESGVYFSFRDHGMIDTKGVM